MHVGNPEDDAVGAVQKKPTASAAKPQAAAAAAKAQVDASAAKAQLAKATYIVYMLLVVCISGAVTTA